MTYTDSSLSRRDLFGATSVGAASLATISATMMSGAANAQGAPVPNQANLGRNVKDFGAIGNGIADDTNAIQAALNSAKIAGGDAVLFPSGTYRISRTLRCASSRVSLVGTGQSSIIKPVGNFDTILFAGAPGQYVYGNMISDLLFDEAAKTGGHTLSGRLVAQFHAMRVYAAAGWNGWSFHNFNNVTLEHCRFEGFRGSYYGKATGGGGAAAPSNRSDVLRLMYLVMGGAATPGMHGIIVDGFVHTVNGWGVHFVGIGARALWARNSTGAAENPQFFTLDDLEADFPGLECVRLDAGQHFFFKNVQLHGTKGAAANIYVSQPVRSVSFSGGFSTGANQAGIAVAGQDVTISGMLFHANNRGPTPVYPGIIVGSTARDVMITGCRSGRSDTNGFQHSGCQVDTGSDGFVIVGNDFRYNVLPGVNNGAGSGPAKVIANNI